MPLWLQIALAIATPAASFGGAYAAIKTHVQYLRRDVDELRTWRGEHMRLHYEET